MISATDFEDIFGWGPPRAGTGRPPQVAAPAALAPVAPEMARPDGVGDTPMYSAPDSEEIFGWCPARARTGLPRGAAPTTATAAVAEPLALDLATAILDAASGVLERVPSTPPRQLVDVVLAERESIVREAQVALEEAQAALNEAELSRAALTVLRDVLAVTA